MSDPKDQFFILGLSEDGTHILERNDGEEGFILFSGDIQECIREGNDPIGFDTAPEALAYIVHAISQGSDWTYAVLCPRPPVVPNPDLPPLHAHESH